MNRKRSHSIRYAKSGRTRRHAASRRSRGRGWIPPGIVRGGEADHYRIGSCAIAEQVIADRIQSDRCQRAENSRNSGRRRAGATSGCAADSARNCAGWERCAVRGYGRCRRRHCGSQHQQGRSEYLHGDLRSVRKCLAKGFRRSQCRTHSRQ